MRCARECSIRDRRCADKGSVVRVEREHSTPTSPRQPLGLCHAQCAVRCGEMAGGEIHFIMM